MVELADTPDLGSGARACRFKSCYPQSRKSLGDKSSRLFYLAKSGAKAVFTWESGI